MVFDALDKDQANAEQETVAESRAFVRVAAG